MEESSIITEDNEERAQNYRYNSHLKNELNLVSRIKRPIFLENVKPNEIYLTRRLPLIVYYNRAIMLLRHQLVDQIHKSNSSGIESFQAQNEELFRLIQEKKLNLKEILNSDESWGTRGIKIHAAGACIKTAFYLLQDILQHYYNQLQLQSQHSNKNSANTPISLQEIEKKISNFLNVKITTNSLKCTDDIYTTQSNIPEPSTSSEREFLGLNPPEENLQHVEKIRFLSTVTIELRINI